MITTMQEFEKALQKQIVEKSYNGFVDLEECNKCKNKTTTMMCSSCKYYKIKNAIAQINMSILTRMKNEPFSFIFNKRYRPYIEKHVLIELLQKESIIWTSNLEDDYMGCIINKNWLNGGIER